MADIELVVKIPEEIYQHYRKIWQKRRGSIPESCIAFGTPLPKGHGRLGDLDALRREVSSWGMNDYEPSDFTDVIDRADTIIESDFHCGVEESGGHAYNCNDCPNKCDEWYQWDKEMRRAWKVPNRTSKGE